MCTAASRERTKRRLAPNGELEGVAPLPYVLFLELLLLTAQCTAARRRGSGGMTAAAAAAVAVARRGGGCSESAAADSALSLFSPEPQSDYSAPLRTQEPARFKPPKIAIAADAAATPPPVLLLVLLPRVCMYVVYGAPLSSRALHIARHFLRSSLNP